MSAVSRVWVGFRTDAGAKNSSSPWKMPYSSGTTTEKTPKALIEEGTTTKWKRFGSAVDATITRARNLNPKNDLGTREITVVTTGRYEPSITINGTLTMGCMDWLEYVYNTYNTPSPSDNITTYEYTGFAPVKTFTIAYIQENKSTAYGTGGKNEYHVLTGCAVDSMNIKYTLEGDAGISFSLVIKALGEYIQYDDTATTDTTYTTMNGYFDTPPKDVFVIGCMEMQATSGGEYTKVATCDSADYTLNNYLAYRGNEDCSVPFASGYSYGTLNHEGTLEIYSNNKYEYDKIFMGIASNNVYTPGKVPMYINGIKISSVMSNSPVASADKYFSIELGTVYIESFDKTYATDGSALIDSLGFRATSGKVKVKNVTSAQVQAPASPPTGDGDGN